MAVSGRLNQMRRVIMAGTAGSVSRCLGSRRLSLEMAAPNEKSHGSSCWQCVAGGGQRLQTEPMRRVVMLAASDHIFLSLEAAKGFSHRH